MHHTITSKNTPSTAPQLQLRRSSSLQFARSQYTHINGLTGLLLMAMDAFQSPSLRRVKPSFTSMRSPSLQALGPVGSAGSVSTMGRLKAYLIGH